MTFSNNQTEQPWVVEIKKILLHAEKPIIWLALIRHCKIVGGFKTFFVYWEDLPYKEIKASTRYGYVDMIIRLIWKELQGLIE